MFIIKYGMGIRKVIIEKKNLRSHIAYASYLRFLEDRGHRVIFKITNSPTQLEARRREMIVANVLVTGRDPVFTAHILQPLLQPLWVM